jgi:transcriptional regulator with XRE-family HTH domain
MPPTRERKRVSFTAAQKKAIHDKKQVDPRLRDEDIAKEYGCSRSTITKILNDDKWKNIDNTNNAVHAKSAKKTMFPRIQEDLDDARIIELVQCPEEDNQDASDAELEEDAKISHSEAKIYLNRIIKYVNQQPVTFSKDIHRQVLRELLSHAHHSAISAMKQGTLDTFFTEM